MNVIDFSNDSGSHPLGAYEGIRKVTAKFVADAKADDADIKASTYYRGTSPRRSTRLPLLSSSSRCKKPTSPTPVTKGLSMNLSYFQKLTQMKSRYCVISSTDTLSAKTIKIFQSNQIDAAKTVWLVHHFRPHSPRAYLRTDLPPAITFPPITSPRATVSPPHAFGGFGARSPLARSLGGEYRTARPGAFGGSIA